MFIINALFAFNCSFRSINNYIIIMWGGGGEDSYMKRIWPRYLNPWIHGEFAAEFEYLNLDYYTWYFNLNFWLAFHLSSLNAVYFHIGSN